MEEIILALDQGTTSSRAILFDRECKILSVAHQEFEQIFPRPGWVEHNPQHILDSQLQAAQLAIKKACLEETPLAAIGITNQRETVLLWEKGSGKPVYNAIVWQCRRSADFCAQLKQRGWEEVMRQKTGLVIDAYFSATKICWLLENVEGLRRRAEKGEILFGTVDTWLIYNLTGEHVTDASNASRTMLFNIHKGCWDPEILKELNIPRALLPRVVPSAGKIGLTKKGLFLQRIPVTGVAGDQQAALFGQTCFEPGESKNTYGTGCFALINTGTRAIHSHNQLLTTVAWDLGKGLCYALEGAVFIAGAAVQWLRDELGIITQAAESEALALSIPDTGGVYFVPAFVGLGAPHWDSEARGLLCGLTRGSGKAQIVRATLESIAYQVLDLFAAIQKDSGFSITALNVDGGASLNNFLMQFQADILGIPLQRPAIFETTALGAAFLAGLGAGIWKNTGELKQSLTPERIYTPAMESAERQRLVAGWQAAVSRATLRKT